MDVATLEDWLEAEVMVPLSVALPSGKTVQIARLLRREKRAGTPVERVASCWAPNKPPIAFGGDVTFAEVVIVRLLERQGWRARWIKNWVGGREFCTRVGTSVPMTDDARATFASIDTRAATRTGGGAWDVFAWNGHDYLCIESKQHKSSDALRPGQIAWLEAALAVGLHVSSFAVVEYAATALSRPVRT